MQVLSSNPLRTREDLARAAADIIRPTLACLTPGKARMIPGYGSAHYSEDVAGMEGFSRVLWALVPHAGRATVPRRRNSGPCGGRA